MPIHRMNTARVRVARTMRGTCGICYKLVVAGQAYEYTAGTNTSNTKLVHFNCYKPDSAPTWEELKEGEVISRYK